MNQERENWSLKKGLHIVGARESSERDERKCDQQTQVKARRSLARRGFERVEVLIELGRRSIYQALNSNLE